MDNASATAAATVEDETSAVSQGRITRVQGSVIDIEFPVGHLPDIYNALTVEITAVGDSEGESI